MTSIVLLAGFVLFGTGSAEFAHNWSHWHEDAELHEHAHPADEPAEVPVHDETNCAIHLQLSLPVISVAWVPLLVTLGVFVAFLTMLTPLWVGRRAAVRLTCRGPPGA